MISRSEMMGRGQEFLSQWINTGGELRVRGWGRLSLFSRRAGTGRSFSGSSVSPNILAPLYSSIA
jgi:hypothetical protein